MVRRCACYFVMYSSQTHIILSHFKNFLSLPEVATYRSRGKASGNYKLRLSVSRSKLFGAMLNKVTVRNVTRLAWGIPPYWSPRVNDHGVRWLKSCIQDFNRNVTAKALRGEDTQKALGPSFNWLKNRNNLRTTGFNTFGVRRSAHSTLHVREGVQVSSINVYFYRSFNTKASIVALRREICKNKNKVNDYKNLIKIISSASHLKLASFIVQGNGVVWDKTIRKPTSNSVRLKIFRKLSKDLRNGEFEVKPAKHVAVDRPVSIKRQLLNTLSISEKIVQKSLEVALVIIYDSVFMACNHSFRPGHNCHTALKQLSFELENSSNHSWVVNGGVGDYFKDIPSKMFFKALNQKVRCQATCDLVIKFLKVEYLAKQKYKTRAQAPGISTLQNTTLSSLSCGIVFSELDAFIELKLQKNLIKRKKRKVNFECRNLRYQVKVDTNLERRGRITNSYLKTSPRDFQSQNFKNLFYVRHLKNWLLLLGGPLKDATFVYNLLCRKFQILCLTPSLSSTVGVFSLKKDQRRFLGLNLLLTRCGSNRTNLLSMLKNNSNIIWEQPVLQAVFYVPLLELLIDLQFKNFAKRNAKGQFFSVGKSGCISFTHLRILNYYNIKIRMLFLYYSLIHNKNQLWPAVKILRDSCGLTMARKLKFQTLAKVFKRFGRGLAFEDDRIKKPVFFRNKGLKELLMKTLI